VSKTVYKYEIPLETAFELRLPSGAKILTVQLQDGQPHIWALVDPRVRPTVRRFIMMGTGSPIPPTLLEYVGTFQMKDLVFHLFETSL
jgi:hypothetical protein